MPFVPPLFSKFGKACSDLLSQKWDAKKDDFNHGAVIKSQTDKVTLTSTVTAADKDFSAVAGSCKAEIKNKSVGDSSVEVSSGGKVKATIKNSHLVQGMIVNAEAEFAKNALTGKTAVEYSADKVATQVEYSLAKNNVVASVASGIEGLSVGLIARADINKAKAGEPIGKAVAVDFGAQYEDGSLTGTLLIEKKSDISLSVFHRASEALQTGAKFTICPASSSNSFATAAQYRFSAETLGKVKAEVADSSSNGKSYAISTYVEHKLANPKVTVGVSNQFGAGINGNFGVKLTFGDK